MKNVSIKSQEKGGTEEGRAEWEAQKRRRAEWEAPEIGICKLLSNGTDIWGVKMKLRPSTDRCKRIALDKLKC